VKQLEATDPLRQQVWEHDSRIYSIVNLTLPPKSVRDLDVMSNGEYAELTKHYSALKFEVDELTEDGAVVKLGRFATVKDAKNAIKDSLFTNLIEEDIDSVLS
jgi:hypothetical protein